MSVKLFITGTDTNAGKTYVSIGILNALNLLGKTTLGIKPIASGCQEVHGTLYNDDAIALQKSSTVKLDYGKINPYSFAPAIAPHIAAKLIGDKLSVNKLTQKSLPALTHPVDICLIEGVGGWLVPLNDRETMADFVKTHQFNVILVIGMRVGCLNHALLTLRALQADHISLKGWIANFVDPDMQYREENLATLQKWFKAPCLGIVEYGSKPEEIIDIEKILS